MSEKERLTVRVDAIRSYILQIFLGQARAYIPSLPSLDDLRSNDAGSRMKIFKRILEALPDEVVLLLEIPNNPIVTDSEWKKRFTGEVDSVFEHIYKYPAWFSVASDFAIIYFNRIPELIQTNVLVNQNRGYRMEKTPDGRVAVVVPLETKQA